MQQGWEHGQAAQLHLVQAAESGLMAHGLKAAA